MNNTAVQLSENHLMPQTLTEKLKMAEMFAASGLMPLGLKSPAQVLVALQMGHELGIPPMRAIQNIAVINGKPTLSADLMLAVAIRTGEVEFFDANDVTEERAIVKIKRQGFPTHTSMFSMEDARRAGLAGKGPWQSYPRRMMKARALAFAVRDVFPDVLAGIYTPDEIGDRTVSERPEPVIPAASDPVVSSSSDIFGDALALTAEAVEAQVEDDDVDLDALYASVKGKVQRVGARSLDLLQQVAPGAERVSLWLPEAKKAGDVEGLQAFERLLDAELAAASPATTPVAEKKGGQHAAPLPRDPRDPEMEDDPDDDPDGDGGEALPVPQAVQAEIIGWEQAEAREVSATASPATTESSEAVQNFDLQIAIIRELGRVGDLVGIPAMVEALGHARMDSMTIEDRKAALEVLRALPSKATEADRLEAGGLSAKARFVLGEITAHVEAAGKPIFVPGHVKGRKGSMGIASVFADVRGELVAAGAIEKAGAHGYKYVGLPGEPEEKPVPPLSPRAQTVLATLREHCTCAGRDIFVPGDVQTGSGKSLGSAFQAVKEELISSGRIERAGRNGWKLVA